MLMDARYYLNAAAKQGLSMAPPERGAEWCETFVKAVNEEPSTIPVSSEISDAYAPVAFVGHGTWHAKCPCGTPQIVCRTDHRMYCPTCENVGAGGAWVAVVWPEQLDEIEALLELRMYDINKNFHPNEVPVDLETGNPAMTAVEYLTNENTAHEVGA